MPRCKTTLSDHQDLVLENAAETCTLNNVKCNMIHLAWGNLSTELLQLGQPECCPDLILGSDCFYDSKAFDDLLFTVAYFLAKNPEAVFITSYQERNADRSIWHLLLKWGMDICEVDLPTVPESEDSSEDDPDAYLSVHLLIIWSIAELCMPIISSVGRGWCDRASLHRKHSC